jgi:hypothetical protein
VSHRSIILSDATQERYLRRITYAPMEKNAPHGKKFSIARPSGRELARVKASDG